MKSHDDPVRFSTPQRQHWRGSRWIMQLHQKRHMKRAGEAGIALRAGLLSMRVDLHVNLYSISLAYNLIEFQISGSKLWC